MLILNSCGNDWDPGYLLTSRGNNWDSGYFYHNRMAMTGTLDTFTDL